MPTGTAKAGFAELSVLSGHEGSKALRAALKRVAPPCEYVSNGYGGNKSSQCSTSCSGLQSLRHMSLPDCCRDLIMHKAQVRKNLGISNGFPQSWWPQRLHSMGKRTQANSVLDVCHPANRQCCAKARLQSFAATKALPQSQDDCWQELPAAAVSKKTDMTVRVFPGSPMGPSMGKPRHSKWRRIRR